jgi:hypothetical protein
MLALVSLITASVGLYPLVAASADHTKAPLSVETLSRRSLSACQSRALTILRCYKLIIKIIGLQITSLRTCIFSHLETSDVLFVLKIHISYVFGHKAMREPSLFHAKHVIPGKILLFICACIFKDLFIIVSK